MKSRFALSFGISLFFVGVLNIFLETNSIILFGLSVSTLIFSLINFFFYSFNDSKLEYLYIIPFIILLSIFCYDDALLKIEFINSIVNSKILNVLTFFSFGLLFISDHYNYRCDILNEQIRNLSVINESLDYSSLIYNEIINYRKGLIKNKIGMDEYTEFFLKSLEGLCEEKIKKCKIESDLLDLKKDFYTLTDFDKSYTDNNKKLNNKNSNKK